MSLAARAPRAVFGLAPVVSLAAAKLAAVSLLCLGWQPFLAETTSPLIRLHGVAIFYFGADKLLYFGSPILVGWAIWLIGAAAVKPNMPAASVIAIALMSALSK